MISPEILSFTPRGPYVNIKNSQGYFFQYDPRYRRTVSSAYTKANGMGEGHDIVQCRTTFQAIWEIDHPTFSYTHAFKRRISRWVGMLRKPNIDIKHVAHLWSQIEDKVCPKDRSTIHQVKGDKGTIIWHLSPFWTRTDTHRSFATLFMRMVVVYGCKTLDASIDAYSLSADIKPAIKHWLGGHTKPSYARLTAKGRWKMDGYTGVINQLFNRSPDELATMLVKPAAK